MNQSAREATEYELIMLGAGGGAENLADRAIQGGLTAALVDHEEQVTGHLRRRRRGEGQDVGQEQRRQCGRVDSRAGAA